MQPSRNNTYSVPASPEVLNYEQQKLTEAALNVAVAKHEISTTDIDQRRVEGFGASMVAAAQVAEAPSSEVVFDPFDPEQILNAGRGCLYIRNYAKEHFTRSDIGLGA